MWVWILHRIELSISPAPLNYCCSLGQSNRVAHGLIMRAIEWKPCPTMCLQNFGHRRPPNGNLIFHGGIYKINTVGNSKRGFTDHNVLYYSRSYITLLNWFNFLLHFLGLKPCCVDLESVEAVFSHTIMSYCVHYTSSPFLKLAYI